MSKKKFKGFTLVECLIALAILGVVSLSMVQVFGAVSRMNVSNSIDSISLANQMKQVERKLDAEAVVTAGTASSGTAETPVAPPHIGSGQHFKVKSSYKGTHGSLIFNEDEYSFAADIIILEPRCGHDLKLADCGTCLSDPAKSNLRYTFVTGRK